MKSDGEKMDVQRKFFITKIDPKANHAGSKAVRDCDRIMHAAGYRGISIYGERHKSSIVNKILNFSSLFKLFKISKHAQVIVDHPLRIAPYYLGVLKALKRLRRIRICFFIHDFETLRQISNDASLMKCDKEMLQIADFLIVHNERMKDYFVSEKQFPEKKIISLGIFDYLSDKDIADKEYHRDGITVAGNLNSHKSKYIYSMGACFKTQKILLYGINCDTEKLDSASYIYKGALDADELPFYLQGRFGLVWDGDSVETCDGATGNYLRYNDPHKFSLYMAAGLPVIVWTESALAGFVKENGVGICVDSLYDVEEKIGAIDNEAYEKICSNVKKIQKKVLHGKYLRKALQVLEEKDYSF